MNSLHQTKLSHPGKNHSFNPVALFLSGVFILLVLLYNLHLWNSQSKSDDLESQFRIDSIRHVDALRTSIRLHMKVVYTLAAFYNASEQISREEFHVFAKTLLRTSPKMQELEWVPKVTAAERDEYEKEAAGAIPGFRFSELSENGDLIPASPRDDYYPVYFVEPYVGNDIAAGFDLASKTAHRDAMNKARDSAQIAISSDRTFIQETGGHRVLLTFLPIYRQGAALTSVAQRRRHLKGFVLADWLIDDMFEHAIARLNIPGVNVWMFDAGDGPQEQWMLAHTSGLSGSDSLQPPTRGLHLEDRIDLAGTQWKVITAPDPQLAANILPVEHLYLYTLLSGLLITGIISWHYGIFRNYANKLLESNHALDHVITHLRQNKKILKQKENKLHKALVFAEVEQSRLEDAIESIDAAIAIYDADERLIICNKNYRLTYHEVADKIVPGASYKELLELYFIMARLERVTGKTINEWVNERLEDHRQHKSEQLQKAHGRWMLISDYPTSEGGVVSLHYDITSLKEAEEKIRALNRTYAVLSRCSSSLARAVDEKQLLKDFCNNVVEIGGYAFAWVGNTQQVSSNSMHLLAKSGETDEESEEASLVCSISDCSNTCTSETAINTGKTVVTRNLGEKQYCDSWGDITVPQGYQSMIALPLKTDNEILGNFSIFSTDKHAFKTKEVSLLEELANNLSTGIGTMRARAAREQKMRLFKKETEQEERKRIAATLHDGVAQTMQAVNLGLKSVGLQIGDEQQEATELLNQAIGNVEIVIDELRNISHDLRPILLERMGLEEAIRHHCNELTHYNNNINIHISNDNQNFKMDELNKEQCFLSFREAMNNAVRHAEATLIEVTIEGLAPNLLSIQIRDNGVGFNTDHKFLLPSGLGLAMISERIQSIGGHAEIHSSPGKGTIVTLIAPAKS